MQKTSQAARTDSVPSAVVPTNRSGRVGCVGSRKPQAKAPYTLLWIDDFVPGLAMYKAMIEPLGLRVLTASSGAEGLKVALSTYLDAVITDYEMPEIDGEVVASAIKALRPGVPVMMFSGSTLIASRCRRVVDVFCDKAGSRDELLAAIHRLLQKKRPPALQPRVVAPASHHGHRTVA
jgi:CheY-like chemotaxis protein